jgi:hypothetical protein
MIGLHLNELTRSFKSFGGEIKSILASLTGPHSRILLALIPPPRDHSRSVFGALSAPLSFITRELGPYVESFLRVLVVVFN